MMLWEPKSGEGPRGNLVSEEETSAGWHRTGVLRGHTDDVMDLAWSPDGSALLSGSIDNRVMVWEISEKKRGKLISQFVNHKHFVQGVAWDPAQQFVVSQSADRTCKVYTLRPPPAGRRNKISQYLQPACDTAKEFYCAHTLSKKVVAPTNSSQQAQQGEGPTQGPKPERVPLFLDESAPTFFRRPSWSPDGAFLALPAGMHRSPGPTGPRDLNTAYLYARGQWAAPIAHLPAQNKPVVAVRFCPVLYRKEDSATSSSPAPFDKLPYKMVFAIATVDSVIVYDTTSVLPMVVMGQLHYDSITELAWSKDGQYLAVSSRDCYCSIAAFQPGELGEPLPKEQLPPVMAKWTPEKIAARKEAADAAAAAKPKNVSSAAKVQPKEPAAAQGAKPEGAAAPAASAATGAAAVVVGSAALAPVRKRIVPEAMFPTAGTEGGSAPKKVKRITPEVIKPLSAVPTQQPAAAPAPAAPVIAPKPVPAPAAEADKGSKRITPTPVVAESPVLAVFDNAVAAKGAAAGTAGCSSAEAAATEQAPRRRITPVPMDPAPAATAAAAPAVTQPAAPAVVTMKPGSLAALAMAAGQKAAADANKK